MTTPSLSRRNLLTWSAVGAGTLGLGPTLTVAGPGAASRAFGAPATTKTRSTLYTPERVAAARANIASLPWAAAVRDGALALAADPLAKGLDWLWDQIPTQGLPRSYGVNQALGSPITGSKLNEWGNYPWVADVYTRPWKLLDPSSGYVFPTNDFASFYASALDANGNFDRSLGDPQCLVNTLYPERGPKWGVDDGYGWIDDAGKRWTFIAYYHHWYIWSSHSAVTGHQVKGLRSGLVALRDAFLYTGDLTYARAGIVALDRVADVYPAMDTSVYARADGFLHSDGLRNRGKVLGSIWENTTAQDFTRAYDAFFPALADGDAAGVVPFLSERARRYGLGDKSSVEAIRANIENNLLRQVFPAVQKAQIFGNFGAHQSTLAHAAVVLDDPVESPRWLDFVFAAGGLVNDPATGWKVTGGNVGPTLVNDVDRDGWYMEAAPHYNLIPISALAAVANALAGYATYPAADLYQHPKYAKMVHARPRLTQLSRYTPSIGDSGQTGKPLLLGTMPEYINAYDRYRDPVHAQMAYLLNGSKVTGLRGDIFSPVSAGLEERVQAVIDAQGPLLNLGSVDLTGFGLAQHRVASGTPHEHSMTIYYGSNQMHGHRDGLGLGYFGHGLDLLPALGYPEFADSNARRGEWTSSTVAGNTTVVDGRSHAPFRVGRPLAFHSGDGVEFSDIEAPRAYPTLERYRRSCVHVSVDDDHGYIVDVFRVRGGSEHVYSFHAAEGPATASGVALTRQSGGSYAGPGILPPDPRSAPRPNANGFDWLLNVERGRPDGAYSVDWDIKDTYGVVGGADVHVRLTMLNAVDEVALADGVPPRNKPGNPASLRYLLARRRAAASRFTSVIEPYRDAPSVVSVRELGVTWAGGTLAPDDVAAVEVKLADGRVDWIVNDAVGGRQLVVAGRVRVTGRLAVVRFAPDGTIASVVAHDASEVLDGGRGLIRTRPVTGVVTTRTPTLEHASTIEVTTNIPVTDTAGLAGRYVHIADDGVRNAVYRIASATARGRALTLHVDTTLVRGFVDDKNPAAGYVYDVEVGRAVRLPASAVWRAGD